MSLSCAWRNTAPLVTPNAALTAPPLTQDRQLYFWGNGTSTVSWVRFLSNLIMNGPSQNRDLGNLFPAIDDDDGSQRMWIEGNVVYAGGCVAGWGFVWMCAGAGLTHPLFLSLDLRTTSAKTRHGVETSWSSQTAGEATRASAHGEGAGTCMSKIRVS